ncbi:hypothetical protein [Streptomyces roseoviridis]|uniref:Uncharacterized protein n=1 Tax=Streptomyces roseoviridis TaxID=67361 RepID=A0ABV5QYM2_9ACTN
MCRTAVLDGDGRELLVGERFLGEELRQRLTAAGWVIEPGDRRANRGPHDTIGGDLLSCPDCVARAAAATAATQRRLVAALARPRVKTVDMSARLGAGWALTQRAGDAERHEWLVECDGTVHGSVNRYQRKDGTFSSGWEAHFFSGGRGWRLDAISSCQKRANSSFLWSFPGPGRVGRGPPAEVRRRPAAVGNPGSCPDQLNEARPGTGVRLVCLAVVTQLTARPATGRRGGGCRPAEREGR